jgi:hypothetical protein
MTMNSLERLHPNETPLHRHAQHPRLNLDRRHAYFVYIFLPRQGLLFHLPLVDMPWLNSRAILYAMVLYLRLFLAEQCRLWDYFY